MCDMTNVNISQIAQRTQYEATVKAVGQSPTPTQILTLIGNSLNFTDSLIARLKSKSEPVACEVGCHYCCYLMATVSGPEALTIAHRLRESWTPDDLDHLQQKLAQAYQQTRALDNVARIKAAIPCPFLTETGRCNIYAYRPLDCMTYHSLSRAACETILEQPDHALPTNPAIQAVGIGVKAGLGHGIAEANLEHPALRYELIEAIHICLNDERAMDKYLAGKNIFQSAAIIIDPEHQVSYKIKYAPPPLKAQAKRIIALERRQARRDQKKRRKRQK